MSLVQPSNSNANTSNPIEAALAGSDPNNSSTNTQSFDGTSSPSPNLDSSISMSPLSQQPTAGGTASSSTDLMTLLQQLINDADNNPSNVGNDFNAIDKDLTPSGVSGVGVDPGTTATKDGSGNTNLTTSDGASVSLSSGATANKWGAQEVSSDTKGSVGNGTYNYNGGTVTVSNLPSGKSVLFDGPVSPVTPAGGGGGGTAPQVFGGGGSMPT